MAQRISTTDGNDVAQIETPRSSRFKFESDKAPLELQRIEEETRRRRDEFRNRVKSIDDRIAKWTSKLTQEIIERDAVNSDILNHSIHLPLEYSLEVAMQEVEEKVIKPVFFDIHSDKSVDDTFSQQGSNTNNNDNYNNNNNSIESNGNNKVEITSSLLKLEKGLSNIKQDFFTFQHNTVFQEENKHLLSLQRILTEQIAPALKLESTKADKREGSLVRTFESIAASTERGLLEQKTLNMAEFSILKDQYEQTCNAQEKKKHDILHRIADIRKLLKKETLERQKQDQVVVNQIIQTQDILQKKVLETMNLTNVESKQA